MNGEATSGDQTTAAQALINGVPVLGIASNLDQYLNMSYVEKFGAGRVLRADTLSRDTLATTVADILKDESMYKRARELGSEMRRYNAAEILDKLITATLTGEPTER